MLSFSLSLYSGMFVCSSSSCVESSRRTTLVRVNTLPTPPYIAWG